MSVSQDVFETRHFGPVDYPLDFGQMAFIPPDGGSAAPGGANQPQPQFDNDHGNLELISFTLTGAEMKALVTDRELSVTEMTVGLANNPPSCIDNFPDSQNSGSAIRSRDTNLGVAFTGHEMIADALRLQFRFNKFPEHGNIHGGLLTIEGQWTFRRRRQKTEVSEKPFTS